MKKLYIVALSAVFSLTACLNVQQASKKSEKHEIKSEAIAGLEGGSGPAPDIVSPLAGSTNSGMVNLHVQTSGSDIAFVHFYFNRVYAFSMAEAESDNQGGYFREVDVNRLPPGVNSMSARTQNVAGDLSIPDSISFTVNQRGSDGNQNSGNPEDGPIYLNVEMESSGNGGLELNWSASPDDDGYVIHKSNSPALNCNASNPIAIGSDSGATYTDNATLGGRTYFYQVQALRNGVLSECSEIAPGKKGTQIVNSSCSEATPCTSFTTPAGLNAKAHFPRQASSWLQAFMQPTYPILNGWFSPMQIYSYLYQTSNGHDRAHISRGAFTIDPPSNLQNATIVGAVLVTRVLSVEDTSGNWVLPSTMHSFHISQASDVEWDGEYGPEDYADLVAPSIGSRSWASAIVGDKIGIVINNASQAFLKGNLSSNGKVTFGIREAKDQANDDSVQDHNEVQKMTISGDWIDDELRVLYYYY